MIIKKLIIPLKSRIAILFFGLAGLVLALVMSATMQRAYEVNIKQMRVTENVITNQILDLCRIALFTRQFDDLQPYLEQVIENPHIVSVFMANRDGVVVVSSSVLDIGRSYKPEDFLDDELFRVEAIKNTSGTLGQLVIQFSNAQFVQAYDEALSVGIKTGIFGLLFLAVVGVLMGHFLTRRLGVLTHAVSDMANGNLDARSGLLGNDEVALVGSTFDRMADSISKYVRAMEKTEKQLMESQERLELRVEERTEELAIARDHALEASTTKSKFLASMSHELRTPLNAIIGYSELLLEDAIENKNVELELDLDKINIAGTHLLNLIDNILDLSKIEAGKMSLSPEWFEVSHCIKDVLQSLDPLFTKSENKIRLMVSPDSGSVYTDKTKVKQVFINLISNAVKFAPKSDIVVEICREIRAEEEWLLISVTDSGIGISEEQLEDLFDEFTQLSSIESNVQKGTGLGLALSQKYCETMGGHINVKSKVGEGSTFTVWLPGEKRETNAA